MVLHLPCLNSIVHSVFVKNTKYTLDLPEADVKRGKLEFTWCSDYEDMLDMQGVACDMTSWGFKVLCNATTDVKSDVKPYAITGSLPLVRSMRDAGYDD